MGVGAAREQAVRGHVAEQGVLARGSQADADRRAAEQAARPVLRRARSPWVGSVSVPMGSGERLPSIFTEAVKLNFDDAATGQGLLNYFLRALNCGAISEAEATATGLTLDELRGKSFVKIVAGRRG